MARCPASSRGAFLASLRLAPYKKTRNFPRAAMIVTCPACSVRYLVDPGALGAKGRTVRCARCSHTWHQEAPADARPIVIAATAVAPEPAPQPGDSPRVPQAEPAQVPRSEERIRLPAVARPKRPWGPAIAWASAAAIVAGLGWLTVTERNVVVGLVPQAARLYALMGLDLDAAGLGLEFRNVTTSRDMENGLPALVIDGQVTNVSKVPRTVPKLVAVLRDRSEHELQDWSFTTATNKLGPGESVPFHTSITQPAEEAAGVVVTFAAGGG